MVGRLSLQQLELLTKKLEESKEKLEQMLKQFTKKDPKMRGDYDTRFPNLGTSLEESADEVEEYANLLPAEYSLELRLQDVNLALEKIKQGNYGICEKCKKEIPLERLKINPEAKFHTECSP